MSDLIGDSIMGRYVVAECAYELHRPSILRYMAYVTKVGNGARGRRWLELTDKWARVIRSELLAGRPFPRRRSRTSPQPPSSPAAEALPPA